MRKLSRYMAAAAGRALPAAVAEKTQHHILDALAAMVSGSRLLPGRMAISYVRSQGGAKQACIAGSRVVTSAVNAALANGMLAHADETDDSHQPSHTHPGSSIVPSAFAMAESLQASGQALLRAVALGYDVGCRTTITLHPPTFYDAGHTSHSFGGLFGSAAAAGSIAKLDESGMRQLLSYTAQQAAGISCWMRDPDHIEKAFDFAGMPARSGVTAATMVAHGLTGVQDVFSGDRNFFVAFPPGNDVSEMVKGLGRHYEIMRTNIKRWSVGSPMQAPLDALLALIQEHGLRPADVDQLTVTIGHKSAAIVNDRDMPDVNMQHLLAVMLLDGTLSFASSHDLERMRDPAVRALKKRIRLVGSVELTDAKPSRQGIVEVRTRDGRKLRHHTFAVRGTADNPMTRAEVDAKCHDLMAPVLGRKRARTLADAIWQLEKVKDVRTLRRLLLA
jgi:2-methylcitrate dehydratase PrpD